MLLNNNLSDVKDVRGQPGDLEATPAAMQTINDGRPVRERSAGLRDGEESVAEELWSGGDRRLSGGEFQNAR